TDPSITQSDLLIGESELLQLETSGKVNLSFNQTLSNLANGTYYFGVWVDVNNRIVELSEEDNTCAFELDPINVSEDKPNLVCGNLGNLEIFGDSIWIENFEVKNIGNLTAASSHIGYYLSVDRNVDRNDNLIGIAQIPPLGPSQVHPESFGTTISGLEAGNYFLGVVVDDQSEVLETSGEDNFCVINSPRIEIGNERPNLICGSLGNFRQANNTIAIDSFQIRNIGEGPSGNFGAALYLTKDLTDPESGIFLSAFDVSNLEVGGIHIENIQEELVGIPNGTYFLTIIIDYLKEVPESLGEDNICVYRNHQITIDSRLPNLRLNPLGNLRINASSLSISNLFIQNNGLEMAGSSKIGVFLSEDTTIRLNDIFLKEIPIAPLDALELRQLQVQADLSTIPNGKYFVGLIVDYQGEILETTNADNFFHFPVPIVEIFDNCALGLEVSTQNSTCGLPNGSAKAIVSSDQEDVNYFWSNGGTGPLQQDLPIGNYSLEISQGENCTINTFFEIFEVVSTPEKPSFEFFVGDNNTVVFRNTSITTDSYFWDFGDETERVEAYDTSHSYSRPGVYKVRLSAFNTCDTVSVDREVIVSADCNQKVKSKKFNDPICELNNGSIIVEVSEGLRDEAYVWSNGEIGPAVTGLAPGTYIVTINDGKGCIISDTTVLRKKEDFEIRELEVSRADCKMNNGRAEIFLVGGLSPYNFFLNGRKVNPESEESSKFILKNLPVGRNRIIVQDAQLCRAEKNLRLESTDDSKRPTIANFSFDKLGRTVEFMDKSENAVRHEWELGDGGRNSIPSPLHTYDVSKGDEFLVRLETENACNIDTFKALVNFREEDPCQFGFKVFKSPASCGQSNAYAVIQLEEGISAIGFEWLTSPGSVISRSPELAPGTYQVIMKSESCRDTLEVELEGNEEYPKANFAYEVTGSPGNFTVNFKNNSIYGDRFEWIFFNDQTQNSEEIIPTYKQGERGFLDVLLIAKNQCGADSLRDTLEISTLRRPKLLHAEPYTLSPNPNEGSFSIEGISSGVLTSLWIQDLQGRTLLQEEFLSQSTNFTMTEYGRRLTSGWYWVYVKQEGTILQVIKMQIQ
ncbi:MAG: CARDB domain-containing protein, partial [Bacteroidota bacterium]